jgi:hypothetical protein
VSKPTIPLLISTIPLLFSTIPLLFSTIPLLFSTIPLLFPAIPLLFPTIPLLFSTISLLFSTVIYSVFNFKNKTDLSVPGSFAHCGFQYVKKESRSSMAGCTTRYNCSFHRKRGCKATISVIDSGGKRTFKDGTIKHTCDTKVKIEQGMKFNDERPAMKARIEEIVITNPACGAKATAREVMKEFVKKNEDAKEGFEFYSVDQLEKMIYKKK